MRGHWPCRLIEFMLLAFRPCRGLFNFAWGGQSIMRDESRRHLPWLPPKTIIRVWRGGEQREEGRGNADPDYPGTRYNLHCEQSGTSGQSAGAGAGSRTSTAPLIACAWRGNLHPHEEEARWLHLHLGECFYTDKETQVVPKGKTQYWRYSMFLHLWCCLFPLRQLFDVDVFQQLFWDRVKSQLHLKWTYL